MQDGLTNGVGTIHNAGSGAPPGSVDVQVAAVPADEDAMDTTPDNSQGLVLPNGSADPPEVASAPSSPAPNGVGQEEAGNNGQAPPAPADVVCPSFSRFVIYTR